VSQGLVARLKSPLTARADFSEVLAGSWVAAAAGELARRPVSLLGKGLVSLGDLCEVKGEPAGRIRFEGDFSGVDRLAAGLAEGNVVVDGDLGREAGSGMAGGSLEVRGNADSGLGGAALEARRGMTGGEIVVHGSVGSEAGIRMRRGLIVIGGDVGADAGFGMIAGSIVILGGATGEVGRWSKRGSIVALGRVKVPITYRYACTYEPMHVRFTLRWLRARYSLPLQDRHLLGLYRRYSGDLADIGRGEILAWSVE
jgi:formylmethanofuran dehydrogenase subunit C